MIYYTHKGREEYICDVKLIRFGRENFPFLLKKTMIGKSRKGKTRKIFEKCLTRKCKSSIIGIEGRKKDRKDFREMLDKEMQK